MKYLTLVLTTASLVGCAGHYRRPESFAAKMARFQPKHTNPNTVPSYEISPQIPENFQVRKSRGPASVQENEDPQKSLPTTKRLYFITLYGQYRKLGQYLEKENPPVLKHCPSFHTTLVNYKENLPDAQKMSVSLEKRYGNLTPDTVGTYPELALPLSPEGSQPRLYDAIKNDGIENASTNFNRALAIHLGKTYKELEELCESGTSENYYNYENLTTHIKRQGQEFGPNKGSLKILLKTTVFSNMTLIESLKGGEKRSRGRLPASTGNPGHEFYKNGLIDALGVQWTQSYLDKLKELQ